jgi:hypothetical protein
MSRLGIEGHHAPRESTEATCTIARSNRGASERPTLDTAQRDRPHPSPLCPGCLLSIELGTYVLDRRPSSANARGAVDQDRARKLTECFPDLDQFGMIQRRALVVFDWHVGNLKPRAR